MGISADPTYQVTVLPLDAAGTLTYPSFAGLIHLIGFINEADGSENLTGVVTAQLGYNTNADAIPLRTNSKIATTNPVSVINLAWLAQPGIAMKLLVTHNPSTFHVDTPPERQLVSSSVGTTITTSDQAITVAAQIAAAAATRQSVTIRSLKTNTDTVYVGGSTVTTGNGVPLDPGESLTIDHTTAAIYAVANSGTQHLRVMVEQ